MKISHLIIGSALLFSFAGLQGQGLRLDSFMEKDQPEVKEWINVEDTQKQLSFRAPQSALDQQLISPVYLPDFARKNPTGYTYLCRLELKIEKDLPLGLWLDIGDQSTTGNPSNANANVRFRFKLK